MPIDDSRETEAGAAPAEPAQAAPDTAREAIHQAITAAVRAGVSQSRIGRESGLSGSAISAWLKGSYSGDQARVQSKLAAWLETREAIASITTAPGARGWVNTPTAQTIERAFFLARSSPGIAVIYGAPGVGKTTAIKHHAGTTPNVWSIKVSPAGASMAAVLKQVAAALDLRGGFRNYDLYNDIVRRLRGTRGLLVVDEADHLTIPALEQLRAIYDDAEIGLVLVGNEGLYSNISGGNRSLDRAQLWSRCAPVVRLPSVKEQDVTAILESWGITGKSEKDYARQIVTIDKGLRTLVKTLEHAALFAADGKAPDLEAMQAAYVETGGAS